MGGAGHHERFGSREGALLFSYKNMLIVLMLMIMKELLENAVDAGALSVRVTLEDDATVTVTDAGRGIPREDVPLVGAPSCTSKIACFEDLARLGTLGFRGEAMSVRYGLPPARIVAPRGARARRRFARWRRV